MVRCYNEDEYNARKKEINEEFKKLINLISELYKKESGGSNVQFNKENADMDKIDKMRPADKAGIVDAIHTTCTEAGIEVLNINRLVNSLVYQEGLIRHLNEVQVTKVFLYILEGFNFAERDLFSPSDPYIIVKCGKKFC